MTDKSQLPFLLRLLDDESPFVRSKVRAALRGFGPDLKTEIAACAVNLTAHQQAVLDELCATATIQRDDFAALWRGIQNNDNEWLKLESALSFLAQWQFVLEDDERAVEEWSLRTLLNDLAREFAESREEHDAPSLARWLFGVRALRGSAPDLYYQPFNSNLIQVLQTGAGLPLSLAAIFMLTGQRLGLEVHGCAFPSHFLARSGATFFDCYNGGRILPRRESNAVIKVMPEALTPSQAAPIVQRVLFNLINAYRHNNDFSKAQACLRLLEQLKQLESSL